MATRDKYNFTQQTILWGTINYNDVPSYSATSVGTTGNAYLVRNFLKQFFPFLDLSVKKTAGGSVNVAIQNFTVKFNFTEGGIFKEFVLNSKSLEDVLEPLFEGQGFDGMTDSTYSIPLPPMYNDEGQDVGYGYGYLFVRNENVEGEYLVNLDNLMFVNKVSFDVPPNSNLNYKSNLFTIPKKTIDYIKSNGVIPTANIPQGIYPTPTSNESDLVTLEKGEENPNPTRNFTKQEETVLKLFSRNEGYKPLSLSEIATFSGYTRDKIIDVVFDLQTDGYVVFVDPNKKILRYELTQKGKNAIANMSPASASTVPVSAVTLTSFEQLMVDYLYTNGESPQSEIKGNFNTNSREWVDGKIDELVNKGVVKFVGRSNNVTYYYLTEMGLNLVSSNARVASSTDETPLDPKQIVFDSTNKSTLTSGDVAAIEFITQNYTILKDMEKESPELYNGISEGLRLIMSLTKGGTGQLEPFKPLENQQQIEDQLKEDDFDLSEVDLEELDLTGLEDDLELNDDELGEFDFTEFNELSDFVESELMPSSSQDARDYAILKTVELMEVGNKSKTTKKILESVNFNNQQKYTWEEIDVLVDKGFLDRSADYGYTLSTKGQDFINEYELKNKQVETVLPPVDIANLNALEKDILRILDEPPAKGKSTLYNEMDSFEIFAKVTDGILPTSDIVKLNEALGALIELKLILSSGTFPETFRLMDNPRTAEIVKQIKNESVENAPEILLLPSQRNVLKVLYDYYKKFPVANEMNSDSIRIVLEQDNIIYAQNQILKYLEELSDFEFVLQNNDFKGNISWIITPDGVDYVENKIKINKGQSQVAMTTSPTDLMLQVRQKKAEKTGDGLDYDYYLIASILNNDTGLVTAGTVTTILQSSFKKNPKWDENEILYKLRVLTSLGMALLDIQNSVEYFEISNFGEDVVKYLIEQENKGLYPKSKPTQQTVASRPSPTESATLNPIGTIKEGNDGNNWQVRANKSGVKRWVKLK
jgi:predicted transcriptional regulator